MDPINSIAKKYHLHVLEDSAQAHGAFTKAKEPVLWAKPQALAFIRVRILIYYMLFKGGYLHYDELSFALEFPKTDFDVVANFKSKTRSLYKASLKGGLEIREIHTKEEITVFHEILTKSLLKHNAKPVHSINELIDLKTSRIQDNVIFYGVFLGEKMIAGSMVFIINKIFHTQYLCADPDYLYLKPMDYMDASLIQMAYDKGFSGFSFGISTEEHGMVLNETLAKYKYGFGTNYYINKTFYKLQNA